MGRHKIVDENGVEKAVISDGTLAIIPPKRTKNGFKEGFFHMSQSAKLDVLSMKVRGHLQARDHDVYTFLLAVMDYDNELVVSQKKIGEFLEMNPPQVSKSIKTLLGLGIIEEGIKIGRSKSYKMSVAIGWKGSGKEHRKQIAMYRKKTKKPNLRLIK